jgi:hypothetical protein
MSSNMINEMLIMQQQTSSSTNANGVNNGFNFGGLNMNYNVNESGLADQDNVRPINLTFAQYLAKTLPNNVLNGNDYAVQFDDESAGGLFDQYGDYDQQFP